MLHTLYSLSKLQQESNIVLDQVHYSIYDSRNFEGSLTIDNAFKSIHDGFFTAWNNVIKPFIDTIMYSHDIYKANPDKRITLIPEEGIYLRLQGLNRTNISYFYTNKSLRLIGIDSENEDRLNNSLSVFNSKVFDPLNNTHYTALTIILYRKAFSYFKEDKDALNRILVRLVNILALNYIDNELQHSYHVPVNRSLFASNLDSNKDIIILPESFNISDSRFCYNYFFTLFRILRVILDDHIIVDYTDLDAVIKLPEIFRIDLNEEEAKMLDDKFKSMTEEEQYRYSVGIIRRIYYNIWNQASKYANITEVPDDIYVDTCTEIMNSMNINFDELYYSADEESNTGSEEESEEEES